MENKNINQKWVNMVNNAVFPIILTTDNGTVEGQGLTKRELFAAMAMQGYISDPTLSLDKKQIERMTKDCVSVADALISELKNEIE